MKIRTVFVGFGGALLAGIIVVAAVGGRSLDKVRIGGEMSDQIIQGKDLVADVLPPPLYIIEAYLESTLAVDGRKPVAEVADRLRQLHSDYNERHDYWRNSSFDADIKKLLTEDSHRPATEFWTAAEKQLLPAIERGDKAAAAQSYAQAAAAYAAHRKVIDEVVARADKINKAVEAAASEQGQITFWSMIGAFTAFFITLLVGIAFMHRRIVAPVLQMTDAMTAMSRGNLSAEVPALGRSDEIGAMAAALSVFRDAALDKARLEEEAERQREAVEAQRIAAQQQERIRAEEQLRLADERARASSDQARLAEAMAAERAAAAKEQADLVQALAAGLENLAEGNLRYRIKTSFSANYQTLCDNFNRAIEQLQTTVRSISSSAVNVGTATSEITLGVADLAQRTEQQSANLERTSASMEQIAATVRQNAVNAARADEIATAARDMADRNGALVSRTVEAVSRIADSAGKISDIITVIDEIARQTNLLALNAAVEAARAGESGRGFAVVASEVRALAQRSSTAANDIKGLIEVSSVNVNEGVDLVSQAGTSLTDIAQSVRSVAELLTDIASASREQAQGVEHINRVLNELDQMTQQNSALVEQNAATSRALDEQSREMMEQVRYFKVA